MACCSTIFPNTSQSPPVTSIKKRSLDYDYVKSTKRRKNGTMFTLLPTVNSSITSQTDVINANETQPSPFDLINNNQQQQQVYNKELKNQLDKRIKEEATRLIRRKQLSFQQQQLQQQQQQQQEQQHEGSQLILNDEIDETIKTKMTKTDLPLFTLEQVNSICEKLCKEREERVKEKYDLILSQKLNEQYDTFVRFTHDQLHKKFERQQFSYVS
jgi:hypothetical protein